MSDHQHFAALALRLIEKNGRSVVFSKIDSTPVDASKPWKGSESNSIVLLESKAAFIPRKGLELGIDFVDDELLKKAEKVCLVAGGQALIESAHTMTDLGVIYKIDWVKELHPGDQSLLYAVGVSR